MKSKPPTYSCLGTGCFEDTAALQCSVCPNVPSQGSRELTWAGTGSTAPLRDRGRTAALAVLEVTQVMLLTSGYKRSEVNGLGWKEEKNMLLLNFLPAGIIIWRTVPGLEEGADFPGHSEGNHPHPLLQLLLQLVQHLWGLCSIPHLLRRSSWTPAAPHPSISDNTRLLPALRMPQPVSPTLQRAISRSLAAQ